LLATLMLLPGGLMALCAVVLVVAIARTRRGRSALLAVGRRMPPRVRAPVVRLLSRMGREPRFLDGPSALHSA
jgi:hypothetical protein